MKFITAIAALVLMCSTASYAQDSQSAPAWKHTQVTDPLRGTTTEQYTLQGKYLTAPPNRVPADAVPVMQLRCISDPKANHGHAHGKYVDGYILVGGVVDSPGTQPGHIHVQLRKDDGKLQDAYWTNSKDFQALYFENVDFNDLLYGHMLPHKPNTSPQVHKLVIGIGQFVSSDVVVEFDLPDSTEVADTCGVTWY